MELINSDVCSWTGNRRCSCRRGLIIFSGNCIEISPKHTCCKFEAEEAKRKQEEEENNKKVEENIEESENTSVEQGPDVTTDKVVNVNLEENVHSLEVVPEKQQVKRKTIDNIPISPIIQNDVEKQLLEGMIIRQI